MAHKRLFLAHYSGDAEEVRELAIELRLHGIVPWIDKEGGFAIADDCEAEARRAIREDCFGLLLYGTRDAFARPFIRKVEVDEALKVCHADPEFALFVVPRGIGFKEVRKLSRRCFGTDLAAYHTVPIDGDAHVEGARAKIASDVLERLLRRAAPQPGGTVSLQFSTRDVLPAQAEDLLCIDATALLRDRVDDPHRWARVLNALRRVKERISAHYGRPRLSVHGSKHLSAAFLFGRVFALFEMDIRQTATEVWRTDVGSLPSEPFAVATAEVAPDGGELFVEVASGYKNVEAGVDALVAQGGPKPSVRLQFTPRQGPLRVSNSLCRAMVKQTYTEIERAVRARHITGIHIFAATYQSYMMMLGREFRGMPPTYLYEWSEGRYVPSCRIPGGVL